MSPPVCILGIDLATVLAKPSYRFKAVFNARGIVVGPMARQHTELRAPGVAFLGDATGDAAAAVIYGGKFEIRAHPALDAGAAAEALRRLVAAHPVLAALAELEVIYAGKRLGRLSDSDALDD